MCDENINEILVVDWDVLSTSVDPVFSKEVKFQNNKNKIFKKNINY